MHAYHTYEIRPRQDKRGVDLISDVLPARRLWYFDPNAVDHAISYARSRSRKHSALIRVYDEAGNVIQTHEHKGALSSTGAAIRLAGDSRPDFFRFGEVIARRECYVTETAQTCWQKTKQNSGRKLRVL